MAVEIYRFYICEGAPVQVKVRKDTLLGIYEHLVELIPSFLHCLIDPDVEPDGKARSPFHTKDVALAAVGESSAEPSTMSSVNIGMRGKHGAQSALTRSLKALSQKNDQDVALNLFDNAFNDVLTIIEQTKGWRSFLQSPEYKRCATMLYHDKQGSIVSARTCFSRRYSQLEMDVQETIKKIENRDTAAITVPPLRGLDSMLGSLSDSEEGSIDSITQILSQARMRTSSEDGMQRKFPRNLKNTPTISSFATPSAATGTDHPSSRVAMEKAAETAGTATAGNVGESSSFSPNNPDPRVMDRNNSSYSPRSSTSKARAGIAGLVLPQSLGVGLDHSNSATDPSKYFLRTRWDSNS